VITSDLNPVREYFARQGAMVVIHDFLDGYTKAGEIIIIAE